MTPKKITIFHNTNNGWVKYNYYAVIQETKSASINKGFEKSNSTSAWLFYKDNYEISLENISIGDIICITDKTNINTQSELQKAGVQTYNITTITNNDIGTYKTRHV